MDKLILDFDDGDLIQTFKDGTAIDTQGHIMMKVSEDYSVDLSTNKLHYTPDWKTNNE